MGTPRAERPNRGKSGENAADAGSGQRRPARSAAQSPLPKGRPALVSRSGAAHSPEPLKVLVVAGHKADPKDLTSALKAEGFEVRSTWPSSSQELRKALNWQPDATLIEFEARRLVQGGAIIRAVSETTAVIVLTDRLTPAIRADYMKSGASAVVGKHRPGNEIATTIRRLAPRRSASQDAGPVAAARRQTGANRPPRSTLAPFLRLTAREQEVLGGLMDGLPARVIALESSVSVSTVRTQIRSILQKLGVNSQLRAVSLARQAGWTGRFDREA